MWGILRIVGGGWALSGGGYPALALATLRKDQANSAKKQALHISAFFLAVFRHRHIVENI